MAAIPSTSTRPLEKEQSLDPHDWEEMRRLGHRMVEEMMDYLQQVRERPAWQKISGEALEALQQPLPQHPQEAASVYEDFVSQVLPYNLNNIHPRFWAWVQGCGTPFGMLADMLASGMNPNLAIGDHSPVYVEHQVLNWSKELFGLPPSASGLLTSGASIANITALIVARNHFNSQIKQKGLQAVAGQLVLYGSSETHNCLIRGVEVIGIGSENFRKAPVDANYRVRIDVMKEMIRKDRAEGYIPFCIVGNAGTVNTGAIDDLEALAQIAAQEGLWYHIDGAFGAIPQICPGFDEVRKGLARADSLAFDFHKWFYMNYEVGCVLIRDAAAHRAAFTSSVDYLLQHERGVSGGPDPFSHYGMELSRGFKALKVWMLLKEHGVAGFARQVSQNLAQAQYLGQLVTESPELELLAPVSLNIVCYRYKPGALPASGANTLNGSGSGRSDTDEQELNRLNKEILMRLQEEGIATPSYTLLDGRYAIRVAITNHRSTREDFEILVRESIRIGDGLVR